MVKVHAKFKAIELRKEGHSYNYIASHVGVSKGTLAVWLSGITYVPNQETIDRIGKARAASNAAKSRIKSQSLAQAFEDAKQTMGSLSARDIFMAGLGIYIGEGSKSNGETNIVNSNPISYGLSFAGLPRQWG